MDWFTGVILYLIIWWVALFAVLPWGLERDADGTPKHPRLKRAFWVNSLVSAILWLGIYFLIEMNILDFRELAASMAEKHNL